MDSALERIVGRVRAAAADATPLCIRGGGTKDFYGEPTPGDALLPLRTVEFAGIASYEPSELVVTARAGTPLAELEAALADKGQCLAFEPPRFGAGTTVGGMVAAGLSGPSRASVGALRDHVLGARLVNGRGELLSFGGQVMKNVAGYDLSRLLAGSLGVLGVIAEVSLKVLPVAPAEATLEFDCGQADALRLLNEWGGRPLPLNASCWMGSGDNDAGVLRLRLRGAGAAVEAACAHLGGRRLDPAQAVAGWQALRDQQAPWFAASAASGADAGDALWRLSVPQTAPLFALEGATGAPLIEWHGGQRWYKAAPGSASRIREAAHAAGGHATLFKVPASANEAATATRIPRFDALSAPLARVHAALMREFDPHGIFNPGRLYAAA